MPPVPFTWIDVYFPAYVDSYDYETAKTNHLGSGYTIEEAYLVGVTNAIDKLCITSLTRDPFAIGFAPSNALPQVNYSILGATNLVNGVWSDERTEGQRFFKVRAKWEK